jgi:hypothetical protein
MAQQTFSGVPGDFTAGQVLTAADMDKLREFLLYLIKDGDEGDTGEVSPLILDLGNDRVGINQDTPLAVLHASSADNDLVARLDNSDSAAGALNNLLQLRYPADDDVTYAYFCSFHDSGGVIGSIRADSAASVAFITTSDYRLKENVADLSDAADAVAALRPVSFSFVTDPNARTLHGFLAHEVAEVVPQAVMGEMDAMNPAVDAVLDDDGNELEPAQPETIAPQMIDHSKLVPLLTAAVQELTARVAALEAAA